MKKLFLEELHKREIVWLLAIIVLLLLYIDSFFCLDRNLISIFDEGFLFLCGKQNEVFTVNTQPLSLGGKVWKSVFPHVDEWDVLTHRQVAFGIKMMGLIILSISSCLYFRRKILKSSFLPLIACLLLFGLYGICGGEIGNGNQALMFIEMVTLSLSLLAVLVKKTWQKLMFIIYIGFVGFFAILHNPAGGGMLFVLSVLFLIFYDGFQWEKTLAEGLWLLLGVVLALLVMHFVVVSIPDCWSFIKAALYQTTEGATHHSISGVLLSVPFAIRDLIMTVTALLGVSYLYRLIKNETKRGWFPVLIGMVLFLILYKWQVKPSIGFVSIITWISFMLWEDRGIGEKPLQNNEFVLFLYLYFMPLCLSFGTNTGILFRAMTFIFPWGLMVYYIGVLMEEKSHFYSRLFYVAVFGYFLFGMGMVNRQIQLHKWDTYIFNEEEPIARMYLTKAQSDFYHEVYETLGEYGYVSRKDTLLGFCFNEMTVVAMDAVPYSNDQQPEEFLLHDKNNLVRPAFMILSEWDAKVLKVFWAGLDWDFPEAYDIIELKNNPDPDSGYKMTQSSLYCLKSRKK